MSKMVIFSKVLSFLVVVVMIFSLAACGQSSNDGTQKPTEQTTQAAGSGNTTASAEQKPELYTIQYFLNTTTGLKQSDETEIGKIIKDKFNIVFQYIPYTGDYREKCNLMLAAGDYPDMLRIEGEDIVQKYVQAGALLPLDDYLKDAPNFNERYKDQIPYWRLSSPERKLYKWEISLPQDKAVNSMNVNLDIIVRTDALAKQGWPKLLSTDDYINFLKQAIKDFPTTNGKKSIGMTLPLGESWGVLGILGCLYEKGDTYDSAGRNMGVLWNYKEKKFESYLTNSYYKESLQFFNKLYQLGLLDKEAFTDHLDQFNQKMESGQTLSAWYCAWTIPAANQKLIAAGHPDIQYINLPVQSNTMVAQGQKRQLQFEESRPFDSVTLTKNAKDPARLFKLVEWASSEEGQILLQSGIEGKDYVIKDGKRAPSDSYIKYLQGGDPGYNEKVGLGCFNWLGRPLMLAKDGAAYDLSMDPVYKDQIVLTPGQKDAFKALGWASSTDWWVKNGFEAPEGLASSVVVDPNSDLGKVHQKMADLRAKESVKVVLSKSDAEFEANYNTMVDAYNKLDYQKVLDEYNRLYQEAKGKLGK